MPNSAAAKITQSQEPIHCPQCGAEGLAIWERNGQERILVHMCAQFHEQIPNRWPYPIELVCRQCGNVQPE